MWINSKCVNEYNYIWYIKEEKNKKNRAKQEQHKKHSKNPIFHEIIIIIIIKT